MRNLIREYFYYSRLERNGIFVLSFLCIAFFLIPKFFSKMEEKKATDFSQFSAEIADFESATSVGDYDKQNENQAIIPDEKDLFKFDPNTVSQDELKALGLTPKVIRIFLNYRSKGAKFYDKDDFKKVYGLADKDYLRLENYIEIAETNNDFQANNYDNFDSFKNDKKEYEPFEFDPNTVELEELIMLGFSEKAANNLIKFRDKGATFRHKEELSKIYGLEESLFEKLTPFIVFDENQEARDATDNYNEFTTSEPEDRKAVYLDVNAATLNDWRKLQGIGPFYAKTILELREDLGGFYAIDQIAEAYRLPDSTFQNIKPYLQLKSPPKKLNLNEVTVEELAYHPYFSWKDAQIIVNYRFQHGSFSSLDDLKKLKVLSSEKIQKMKPYLSL